MAALHRRGKESIAPDIVEREIFIVFFLEQRNKCHPHPAAGYEVFHITGKRDGYPLADISGEPGLNGENSFDSRIYLVCKVCIKHIA